MNKIEVKNLSYAYIKKPMLYSAVNFSTTKNLIFVFGASGSGKTTLIENLCGLNDGYFGEVLLNGKKPRDCSMYISYIPSKPVLLDNNTVEQNLQFACDVLGKDYSYIEKDDWFEKNKKIKSKKLPKIDKFLLMIKRAKIKNPKFLFIDFADYYEEEIENCFKIISQYFNESATTIVVAISPIGFQKLQNYNKNAEILYIKCPNIEKYYDITDMADNIKYADMIDYLGLDKHRAKVALNQNGYFLEIDGRIVKLAEKFVESIATYFEVSNSTDVDVVSKEDFTSLSDFEIEKKMGSGDIIIFDSITNERLN